MSRQEWPPQRGADPVMQPPMPWDPTQATMSIMMMMMLRDQQEQSSRSKKRHGGSDDDDDATSGDRSSSSDEPDARRGHKAFSEVQYPASKTECSPGRTYERWERDEKLLIGVMDGQPWTVANGWQRTQWEKHHDASPCCRRTLRQNSAKTLPTEAARKK